MTIFFTSDLHLGDKAICTYIRSNGEKLRPFQSTEEMNQTIIDRWNSVVRATDKVYVLGDVVIDKKCMPLLGTMNGSKILIKGNHDTFKLSVYQSHFKDVRATHKLDDMLLSHIPLHSDHFPQKLVNVHGHLHHNTVQKDGRSDPRFYNVSVERHDYTPIAYEDLLNLIRERFEYEQMYSINMGVNIGV